MASLAAKGVDVDRNAMTAEEREMFVDLLEAIETNHDRVVGKVQEPFQTSLGGDAADAGEDAAPRDAGGADGAAPPGAESAQPGDAPPDGTDGRGAAASHVDDGEREDRPPGEAAAADAAAGTDAGGAGPAADAVSDAATDPDGGPVGSADGEAVPAPDAGDGDPPDGFVRVRVVEEIPGFVGTDGVEYDPDPEDVVTIPEENAEALVGRDAAEPLDDAGPT